VLCPGPSPDIKINNSQKHWLESHKAMIPVNTNSNKTTMAVTVSKVNHQHLFYQVAMTKPLAG